MQNNNSTEAKNVPTNYIIFGVLAVVIIGTTIFAFTNSSQQTTSDTSSSSSSVVAITKDETILMTKDDKSSDSMISTPSGDTEMTKAGTYTNYSESLLANASTGEVVIFFNASWCPTCKSTIKDINANLDKIPSSLTILSADYDKETALRRKYGVTMQHTFVKVDKDGNLIKKQSGLSTVGDIANFAKI